MSFSRTVLFLIFLLSALGTALVFGQEVTGAIAGVIKDATGAQVPDAMVTAVNAGTGATYNGKSDGEGVYSIRSLPVGIYNLTASVPGFKKYDANAVRVQVNETSRVDLALQVGADHRLSECGSGCGSSRHRKSGGENGHRSEARGRPAAERPQSGVINAPGGGRRTV